VENATEFMLKNVQWDFFGTLTWSAGKLGSVRSRDRDAWGFFRDWATFQGVRLHALPVVLRWERGEIGDRPHAHFLLKHFDKPTVGQCFFRMHCWNTISGFGFARVRLYHSNLVDFAQYVTKDLQQSAVRSSEVSNANKYELGKFDYCDRLCINDAAWRLVCEGAGVPYFPQTRSA
jgi:hypothetical protein